MADRLLNISNIEHLYSSGTFWAAVAALAALMTVIFSIVRWRREQTRPTVTYRLTFKPHESNRGAGALVKFRSGETEIDVNNPYEIVLNISNMGRKDVLSKAFDLDRPLIFDLSVPIRGTLNPEDLINVPPFKTQDTQILVGPMLIPSRQTISLAVLTDGPVKTIKMTLNPIENVRMKSYAKGDEHPAWRLISTFVGGIAGIVCFLGIISSLGDLFTGYFSDMFQWLFILVPCGLVVRLANDAGGFGDSNN